MQRQPRLLTIILAATLAGCSGGGGSTPAVPQRPPAGVAVPAATARAAASATEEAAVLPFTGHDPVILIPGMTSPADEMAPMRLEFQNAGWPANRLFMWTDSTNMEGDLAAAAVQLQGEVKTVLAQAGAQHVVLVTWSAAALAARYYIKNIDRSKVSVYVGMAGPQHGTTFNDCQAYESCREFMSPNTPFLTALNAGTEVPGSPRIAYMTVRSDNDINVAPEDSAMLAGANVNDRLTGLTAPTHFQYPEDPATFAAVKSFILEVERHTEPSPGT